MKAFLTRETYNTEMLRQMLADNGIELECRAEDSICPKELIAEKMGDVDALLTHTEDEIGANLIAQSSEKLKVIANMGIGFSNIDTMAAQAKNIAVTNTPVEEAFEATAEASVAMLLSIARRIPALHVERARLRKDPNPSFLRPTATSVRNKVTGIIGMGRIGSRVAKIMHSGFNNKIIYYDHHRKEDLELAFGAKKVELDELARSADFICINAPLNQETQGLVSADIINKIKPGSTVINTARGELIDEQALIKRLNNGSLHGAGLDVYGPSVNDISAENVALTSHFANFEDEAYTAMTRTVANNVIAALTGGQIPNKVNCK